MNEQPQIPEALEHVAVLLAVERERPMLGAILDRAESISVRGGELLVRFSSVNGGIRRAFDGHENHRTVEEIASRVLGRHVQVTSESGGIELDSPWARLRELGFEMKP